MYKVIISIVILYMTYIPYINGQNNDGRRDIIGVACEPVSKFRIKKFESGKKFKIVIDKKTKNNEDIEYKSSKGSDTKWKWEIGSMDPTDNTGNTLLPGTLWKLLLPSSSSNFSRSGEAHIPAEYPMSNDDFGETRGHVVVTNGAETANQTVEVFYRKDEDNPHSQTNPVNTSGNDPNWFHYWGDAAKMAGLLHSDGFRLYSINETGDLILASSPTPVNFTLIYHDAIEGSIDWSYKIPSPGTTIYNVWASNAAGNQIYNNATWEDHPDSDNLCVSNEGYGYAQVMTGYGGLNFVINIGESCGYKLSTTDYRGASDYYTAKIVHFSGIENFTVNIIHEMWHWKLREELWKYEYNSTIPTGYSTGNDCDHDGFPDDWEAVDMIANHMGFLVGNGAAYTDIYNDGYDVKLLNKESSSTWYQEWLCRNKQFDEISPGVPLRNILFDSDWSFKGKKW